MAFAHAHGEVHAERDTSHARANAIQRDFFTQAHVSNSRSEQLTNLGWTLVEW
jgi:hypothetical protein